MDTMTRKEFLKLAGLAITSTGVLRQRILGSTSRNVMDRVGLTTVVFREYFPKTSRLEKPARFLDLMQIPQYFRERFGVSNLEFWTNHFESTTPAFLSELRREIQKARCQLINLQVDTPGCDVSSIDDFLRIRALKEMQTWIDRAVILGSPMVRVSAMKGDLTLALESLVSLKSYADAKGVRLLVENHNDLFSDPDLHLRAVTDSRLNGIGVIADFGNYPAHVDPLKALKRVAPHTTLVSAKVKDFDSDYRHLGYSFPDCVRLMEQNGFKGIYSIEQWSKPGSTYDFEVLVDRTIEMLTGVLATNG
jgi:sugar phosphate isomerase/epimerase